MAGTPIRTVCLPIFLIAFIAANVHTAEADPVETINTWESKRGCCRVAGDGDAHQDSSVVKMYRKVSQKKALRQCKTACIDSNDCTAFEIFRKGKKSKKMYQCELHTAGINSASKRSKSCKRATCSIVTRTCNTGYTLNGQAKCDAHTCTCTDGMAAVAADGSCEVDDAEDCTACNTGYTLSGQVCDAHTCTCTGGTAAIAADGSCEVDDAEDCTACDTGYTLSGQVCGANTCTCTGGTAAIAADGSCEVDDAEDCTACDAGYTLNGQVCDAAERERPPTTGLGCAGQAPPGESGLIGSWKISDGPAWGTGSNTLSCVDECACQYGAGVTYHCSVSETSITNTAYYQVYGNGVAQLFAEDYDDGCDGPGNSYKKSPCASTYLDDHGLDERNYCFQA